MDGTSGIPDKYAQTSTTFNIGSCNGGIKMCKQMLNILSVLLQAAAVCAVPIYKLRNDQIGPVDAFLMIFAAVFVFCPLLVLSITYCTYRSQ
jgi:hypothetical protein